MNARSPRVDSQRRMGRCRKVNTCLNKARPKCAATREKVKDTVSDDARQDTTHSGFYSLKEVWEKCVETVQADDA